MKKYKVYECEVSPTKTGKNPKKLVLQGEGDQYPLKGVTMWDDHELYPTIDVGQEHMLEVETKDSTTPNPHGGFYKNRTVLKSGQTSTATPNVSEMGIKTHIDQKFAALQMDLKVIADHLGVEAPTMKTEVPPVVAEAQNITPEDIPF
jgi:hypothetical protein